MAADAQMVLRGKQGWLFLNNDSNDVIRQVTGAYHEFDSEAVAAYSAVVNERRQAIECPYLIAVAPNNECVYPEFLPDGITFSEDRPVRKLISAVDGIVYPLERMRGSDLIADLYQRTDTHWNAHGAFLFAQEMLREARSLGVDVPLPSMFDVSWVKLAATEGDLGSKVSPPESSAPYETRFDGWSFHLDYNNGINNRGLARVYTSNKPLPTTAIMFCDSFGFFYLARILARYIGKVICVRHATVDIEMVARIKPDLVITEIVERFLVQRPNAFGNLGDTIRDKIRAGQVSPAEIENFRAAGPDAFGILPESSYRNLVALVDQDTH